MAAAPSSLGTHFKEELSCSICLELFTRPKVLPCQHTFCQDCLQDKAGRGQTFQCPNCRWQVRLPPQGVAGLPDNLTATNMCERFQQQTTLSGETSEKYQCANRCSSHPSEELKVYCTQCQVRVCDQCLEEGHDDHQTTSIKKAAQERSSTVQPLINKSGVSVFQPTDTPVPVLGHVAVQPLPSAPIPAATASSDGAAGGTGHHHGNQRQGEQQPQKVTFGGWESGTGQVEYAFGVTVSDEGEIFVADYMNKRIKVFTLQGTFVRQFPTVVSGKQEMDPDNVATDGEGNLWVVGDTDSAEFAVQYDRQGRVLRKFDLQKTEWMGGVAVDTRRNHILITQTTGDDDNPQGEVLVFRKNGIFLRTVGQQQGMKIPQNIAVDREGNVFVSDVENHCIYVYNEDGQFLFQFGEEGSGEGQLQDPHGICTDRAGNIIVADEGNSRVEMFDETGKFLKHIATDMKACGVAIATQGQLVVTDYESVNIFQNFGI